MQKNLIPDQHKKLLLIQTDRLHKCSNKSFGLKKRRTLEGLKLSVSRAEDDPGSAAGAGAARFDPGTLSALRKDEDLLPVTDLRLICRCSVFNL